MTDQSFVQIHLFDDRQKPRNAIVLGFIGLFIVWGGIIYIAAYADDALYLNGKGIGLLEHFGFVACLASGPLVLLATIYSLSYFFRLIDRLDDVMKPNVAQKELENITQPQRDSLLLKGKWRGMLGLFIFIGFVSSFLIFGRLDSPVEFWGNDVFNARVYRNSFWAANSLLLVLWSVIYPIAVFYAVHITVSSAIIVARLKKHDLLSLNFLHIDRCCGMSGFGTLNFMVMLIYLCLFAVACALFFTHSHNYLSLAIGGLTVSAGFALQSIYGIYWVSKVIKFERNSLVLSLNDRVEKAFGAGRGGYTVASAALAYRAQVLSVASYPYSKSVGAAVNVMRFAPAAIALLNLWVGVQAPPAR